MAEDEVAGEILIVTGMSGAGRTTAANALEDLDWYVVDNLPPQMLRPLLDISDLAAGALPKIAAVVDVRGRDLFRELPAVASALRAARQVRVLFLDASDDVLVRRFESVRRPHPLQADGTILDGIRRERERLAVIRESADVLIDTSALNIHQLATRVVDLFSEEGEARHTVTVMSFGFKYGLPTDVDLVADMRFLPNPFWIPELRPKSGLSRDVAQYVLKHQAAQDFQGHMLSLLATVAPGYLAEGKRQVTVAIGCTGGKHRSTSMAEELAIRLRDKGFPSTVLHRDLGKE